MKEPNEVKTMQDAIRKVYQNKKNSLIKENYKNIDVLPTVYDSPEDINVDNLNLDDPTQEGFRGLKKFRKKIGKGVKKIGKGLKKMGDTLTKPFERWEAPYSGPPRDGPINDIGHNPANNINNIILTGESLLKWFSMNSDLFKDETGKKMSSISFKDMLGPFDKCPCIKTPRKFSLKELYICLQSFFLFFTDYIPCLINGYSDLVVRVFTTKKEKRIEYYIKKDKEDVKTSIFEFLYILVTGYLTMMIFYYSVIDGSSKDGSITEKTVLFNPAENTWEMTKKFVLYGTFPFIMFNTFIKTILPFAMSAIGLSPFAQLKYVFIFIMTIICVFNGLMDALVDLIKKSLNFRAHWLYYISIVFSILMDAFNIIIPNDKEGLEYEKMVVELKSQYWYIVVAIYLLTVCSVFVLAPLLQFSFLVYIFYLFLFLPILSFFKHLTRTTNYLLNPDNNYTSGDTTKDAFLGELNSIIAKYVFPVLFPLVMVVFFGYRLSMCGNLHSRALRIIMIIINLVCFVSMSLFIFFRLYNPATNENQNNNTTTSVDASTSGPTSTSGPISTDGTELAEKIQEAINKNGITETSRPIETVDPSIKIAIEEKLNP